jgi:hypothetical protein
MDDTRFLALVRQMQQCPDATTLYALSAAASTSASEEVRQFGIYALDTARAMDRVHGFIADTRGAKTDSVEVFTTSLLESMNARDVTPQ